MTSDYPSLFEFRAAMVTARLLPVEGGDRATIRKAYLAAPSEGQFNLEDLIRGEELLVTCGLVDVEGDRLRPLEALWPIVEADSGLQRELLLQRWVEVTPAPWAAGLPNLPSLSDVREALPTPVADILDQIERSDEALERLLYAMARRADPLTLKSVGDAGERYVVSEWKALLAGSPVPDLAARVVHVSLVSDQLGYDIFAPRLNGDHYRLEVKTTVQPASQSFPCFLSRGEYTASLRFPGWRAVLCRILGGGPPEVVGWVDRATLQPYLPEDGRAGGRWESARLLIPSSEIAAGLPPL